MQIFITYLVALLLFIAIPATSTRDFDHGYNFKTYKHQFKKQFDYNEDKMRKKYSKQSILIFHCLFRSISYFLAKNTKTYETQPSLDFINYINFIMSIILVEEPMQNHHQKALKYFDLMEKVGTKNNYQCILFFLAQLIFLMNAILNYGVSFVFMNTQFDCQSRGIFVGNCQQYVCQNYSTSEVVQFPVIQKYKTLATQFGPYYCQQNYKLGLYRGILAIGTIIGVVVSIIYSDNKSRRTALLLCLLVTLIGLLSLVCSLNMGMACLSLFFVGFGSTGILRIIMAMMSQTTDRHLVQKLFSLVLLPFCLGQIFTGSLFSITSHWRSFSFFFCLLPTFLTLILAYIFIQDTPKFLLKGGQQYAIAALNRISALNKIQFRYQNGDLQQYIQYEQSYSAEKETVSLFDVFRYKSLRISSICFCSISLAIDFLFYAYSAMSDKIGFNPVLNGYLIGGSQLIAVPFAFLISPYTPRRLSGIIIFTIICAANIALTLLVIPMGCEDCSQVYIQIGLVMISAWGTAFQTIIIYQHLTEFYPVSIRTIGIGLPTAFGGLAIFLSQFLVVAIMQLIGNAFPLVVIFTFCFGIIGQIFIAQTLNTQPKDKIEEIEIQRQMKERFKNS